MILSEILDKPLEFNFVERSSRAVATFVTLPDGKTLSVKFGRNSVNERRLLWSLAAVSFLVNGETATTGNERENVIKIFSTVASVIKKYVEEYPVDILIFAATDAKKQHIYHRILSRFLQGSKYEYMPQDKRQFIVDYYKEKYDMSNHIILCMKGFNPIDDFYVDFDERRK